MTQKMAMMKALVYKCLVCSDTRRWGTVGIGYWEQAEKEGFTSPATLRCANCKAATRHRFVYVEMAPFVSAERDYEYQETTMTRAESDRRALQGVVQSKKQEKETE